MPDPEHAALRGGVGLSELSDVAVLRLSGEGAFDALDRLVPANLFIGDGQMLHTLFLDVEGHPLADLYVCCDDEDFLLLVEGMSGAEVEAHFAAHQPVGLDLELADLGESHGLLSLNGPWAWELLAEWLGPDVIGIPYLTFFHLEERDLGEAALGVESPGLCFRAGKTGEYGYDLVLRRELLPAARQRLVELGEPMGLVEVSRTSLDQCALENGFFCVRAGSLEGLTPLELQLQWRLAYDKDALGVEALRARRAQGALERLTTFVAAEAVAAGEEICWRGRPVGRVWAAGASPLRGDWVGLALLERALAHVGIDELLVGRGDGARPIRTVSAPVLNNLSLYVDPRRHCYRYRGEESFPPLVLGG